MCDDEFLFIKKLNYIQIRRKKLNDLNRDDLKIVNAFFLVNFSKNIFKCLTNRANVKEPGKINSFFQNTQ